MGGKGFIGFWIRFLWRGDGFFGPGLVGDRKNAFD